MSLPAVVVRAIRDESETAINLRIKNNKTLLADKKKELGQEEIKMISIEEKWINNQINQETYQRWFTTIINNRMLLNASISRLSQDQDKVYNALYKNLERLTDLKYVFTHASTTEKQELIRLGFDNNLYYQDGIYRTPTMIDELSHNSLVMKGKGLLIYEKKRENLAIPPLSGPDGTRTRDLRRDRAAF
jgi:site-specific DNA recombinase